MLFPLLHVIWKCSALLSLLPRIDAASPRRLYLMKRAAGTGPWTPARSDYAVAIILAGTTNVFIENGVLTREVSAAEWHIGNDVSLGVGEVYMKFHPRENQKLNVYQPTNVAV
eukprot:GHVT01015552.1.p1 GENE.GHVT01015552.1~~GHVT01015552.1.p1  ORF type:complete len:113 (+),score=7.90 GHVT01015552.1:1045-1383(+)